MPEDKRRVRRIRYLDQETLHQDAIEAVAQEAGANKEQSWTGSDGRRQVRQ